MNTSTKGSTPTMEPTELTTEEISANRIRKEDRVVAAFLVLLGFFGILSIYLGVARQCQIATQAAEQAIVARSLCDEGYASACIDYAQLIRTIQETSW